MVPRQMEEESVFTVTTLELTRSHEAHLTKTITVALQYTVFYLHEDYLNSLFLHLKLMLRSADVTSLSL